MPDLHELLTVILGALLGVRLFAAPRTTLRLPAFIGPIRRCHSDYGTDNTTFGQQTWIARGLGVASLTVAAFIACQTYT